MSFFDVSHLAEPQPRIFIPRYLDSPIIVDQLQETLDEALTEGRLSSLANHLRTLLTRAVTYAGSLSDNTHSLSSYSLGSWSVRLLTPYDLIDLSKTCQRTPLNSMVPCETAREQARIIQLAVKDIGIDSSVSFRLDAEAREWFERETSLTYIQRQLVSERARGSRNSVQSPLVTSLSQLILLSDKYVIFIGAATSELFIGSYTMYLCCLDIVRVRGRSLLACSNLRLPSSLPKALQDQWEWQEEWIRHYGNEGFNIAKKTEALAKATLAYRTDPDLPSLDPRDGIWATIESKLEKMEPSPKEAQARLLKARRFYEDFTRNLSVQEIVELFGCQKNIGHPFIYAAKGGKSAAKEALQVKPIDPRDAILLRAAWMSRFTAGYLLKEGKWPILYFSPEARNTPLYKWYSCGYLNVRLQEFKLEDWNGVIPGKLFSFNYFENYLDLIDDKSISFNRDELDAFWNERAPRSTSKRLLLEVLSREGFSYRAVVDMMSSMGAPFRFRVVALYPKEKEMKPEARMFSIMVMEMRMFFAGLEANIADSVFPYISSQTMTKAKQSIQELFYSVTDPKESESSLHFFIECDLSRWNLNWRYSTMALIGQDLDLMFGQVSLFSSVHPFFSSCVIVVRTPALRPDGIETGNPPSSDLCWYNHLGGFEGIAQKQWTLATYAMMDIGMMHHPCSYILIGQGDNQILSITASRHPIISLDEQYRTLSSDILSTIAQSCAKVGQDLKPEECLVMRRVITYSKDVWINGVQMYTSVKFVSRLAARTADQLPSLTSELVSLGSGALAAAEYTHYPLQLAPIHAFLFAMELGSRVFESHPEWDSVAPVITSRLRSATVADYLKMLWWPSALGGMANPLFTDYLHRGAADPTAEQVAALLRGISVSDMLSPLHRMMTDPNLFEDTPDLARLLEDPYCLPLRPSPSSSGALASLVETYLARRGVNKDLIIISDSDCQEYYSNIKETLTTMRPFYPVIARDILDYSAAGEAKKLSKMFSATQTVQLASREIGLDGSELIVVSSGREFESIVSPLLSLPPIGATKYKISPADFLLPKTMREKWTQGGAYPEGVDSVSPIYSSVSVYRYPSTASGVKLIAYLPSDPLTTRGPFRPYLGARTKLERSQHGYKLIGDSRPAAALRRLQTIRSIPNLSESLGTLIDLLAKARCENIGSLQDLAGSILSTNVEHRYQGRDSTRGSSIVAQGNLATHCFFVSDEIDKLSGTRDDYQIMFQEWYTYLIGLLGALVSSPDPMTGYVELVLAVPTDLMDPITTFSATVSVENSLTPPPTLLSSIIVHDPSVWRLEHDGPLPITGAIQLEEETTIDDESLLSSAIMATISRSGITSGMSAPIIEGQLSMNRPLQLDLIEIRILGASRILMAASKFVALELGYRVVSEMHIGNQTGRKELYRRRLCAAMARSLAVLFSNPQLSDDEIIQQIPYSSSLTSHHEPLTPVLYLSSIIGQLVNHMIHRPWRFFTREYIFGNERVGRSITMAVGLFGLCLCSSLYHGSTWETVIEAVNWSGVANSLVEGPISQRHHSLSWAISGITTHLAIAPRLCTLLDSLGEGKFIRLVEKDSRATVRSSRVRDLPEFQLPMRQAFEPLPIISTPWMTQCSCGFCQELFTGTLADLSYLRHRLTTPRVRGSQNFFLWTHVLSGFSSRPVVSVGVGLGGCVLAALELGCPRVTGVDLPQQYDLSNLRSQRPPYAASSHRYSKRFKWAPAMYLSRLGWLSREVRQGVVASTDETSVYVIDIQPAIPLRDLLPTLEDLPGQARVIIRRSLTYENHRDVIKEASSVIPFGKVKIIQHGDRCEAFLIITVGLYRQYIHKLRSPPAGFVDFPREQVLYSTDSILFAAQTFLSDFSVVMMSSTLGSITIDQTKELVRGLIGRGMASFSFDEWTTILGQLYCLSLLSPSGVLVARALASIKQTVLPVEVFPGNIIVVRNSPFLVSMITNWIIPLHWYSQNTPGAYSLLF